MTKPKVTRRVFRGWTDAEVPVYWGDGIGNMRPLGNHIWNRKQKDNPRDRRVTVTVEIEAPRKQKRR